MIMKVMVLAMIYIHGDTMVNDNNFGMVNPILLKVMKKNPRHGKLVM